MHLPYSGHNRGEGSDHRDKTREDDGLRAVTFEESSGPLYIGWIEPQRFRTREYFRPSRLPEEITDGISAESSEKKNNHQNLNLKVALRRKKTGGKQETVSRQEEADEKTRLSEDDSEKPEIPGSLYE